MEQFKLFGLLFFIGQSFLCVGQTQNEIEVEARNKLINAETEMNATLSQIRKLYKTDVGFLKNLKESQDIWIKFREAQFKMKFPDHEPGYYGSAYPICVGHYLTDLTLDRVKNLKTWVTGIEEGDVCSGSVRRKD